MYITKATDDGSLTWETSNAFPAPGFPWPKPGYCRHWGRELVEGRSLFSLSWSLMFKLIFKIKNNFIVVLSSSVRHTYTHPTLHSYTQRQSDWLRDLPPNVHCQGLQQLGLEQKKKIENGSWILVSHVFNRNPTPQAISCCVSGFVLVETCSGLIPSTTVLYVDVLSNILFARSIGASDDTVSNGTFELFQHIHP